MKKIKEYVLKNFGFKVSSLYIAQTKRKFGITMGENYNLPKNADASQPQCPIEKEDAIVKSLKHFKMMYRKIYSIIIISSVFGVKLIRRRFFMDNFRKKQMRLAVLMEITDKPKRNSEIIKGAESRLILDDEYNRLMKNGKQSIGNKELQFILYYIKRDIAGKDRGRKVRRN